MLTLTPIKYAYLENLKLFFKMEATLEPLGVRVLRILELLCKLKVGKVGSSEENAYLQDYFAHLLSKLCH